MTWEPTLPALSTVIIGIVVLIYGSMRWKFIRMALFKFVLTISFIAALIYVYRTVTWGPTGKDLFALLAAIPGTIALIWNVRNYYASYLHISLRVDLNENGFLSTRAVVENKSISIKELSNALLLVGPEHEDPRDTMHELGFKDVKETDDIVDFKIHRAKTGPNGRSLIPLPFFYSENDWISDEKVSYRAPINTRYIPKGVPYSVRFFISTPGRLHRSTHDSFVLPHLSVNWI